MSPFGQVICIVYSPKCVDCVNSQMSAVRQFIVSAH
jgi:endonuclease III